MPAFPLQTAAGKALQKQAAQHAVKQAAIYGLKLHPITRAMLMAQRMYELYNWWEGYRPGQQPGEGWEIDICPLTGPPGPFTSPRVGICFVGVNIGGVIVPDYDPRNFTQFQNVQNGQYADVWRNYYLPPQYPYTNPFPYSEPPPFPITPSPAIKPLPYRYLNYRPEMAGKGLPARQTGPRKAPGPATQLGPSLRLRKKPTKGEKEKKMMLGGAPAGALGAALRKAVNGLSEGLDLLEAAHDALPPKYRKPFGTPQEKALQVYRHLSKMSPGGFLMNLAENEIEDQAFGKIGKALQRGARSAYDKGYLGRGGLGSGPTL